MAVVYDAKGMVVDYEKVIFDLDSDGESLWCRLCGRWAPESHIKASKHVDKVDQYYAEPSSWKRTDFKDIPVKEENDASNMGNIMSGNRGSMDKKRSMGQCLEALERRCDEQKAQIDKGSMHQRRLEALEKRCDEQQAQIDMLRFNVQQLRQDRRPSPY